MRRRYQLSFFPLCSLLGPLLSGLCSSLNYPLNFRVFIQARVVAATGALDDDLSTLEVEKPHNYSSPPPPPSPTLIP
jgi:hypothetical protein